MTVEFGAVSHRQTTNRWQWKWEECRLALQWTAAVQMLRASLSETNYMRLCSSSARFDGSMNVDLNEITMNLVPFPRLHYLVASQTPLFASADVKVQPRRLGFICQLLYSNFCACIFKTICLWIHVLNFTCNYGYQHIPGTSNNILTVICQTP